MNLLTVRRWYDIVFIIVEALLAILVIGIGCCGLFGVWQSVFPGAGDSFYARTTAELMFVAMALGFLVFSFYAGARQKNSRLSTYAIYIFLFLFMLAMNLASPAVADDFAQTITAGPSIEGVRRLFSTVADFYQTWSGRSIATFFSYGGGMIGDLWVFDILNAIVFCLFIYLLSYFVSGHRLYPMFILFLFATTWFFQPVYGQVFLWRCGAANYLWTTTIVLTFLRLSLSDAISREGKMIWKSMGIFLLGLLAGWCNENTGITILFILIAEGILRWRFDGQKPKPAYFAACIGALVGTVILLRAPGNYVRMATEGTHNAGGSLGGMVMSLLGWVVHIMDGMIRCYAVQIFLVIVFASIYSAVLIRTREKGERKREFIRIGLWIVAFAISMYSFAFAFGGVADRAYFFSSCILYLLIAYCARGILAAVDNQSLDTAIFAWSGIIAFILLLSFSLEVPYSIFYDHDNDVRIQDLLSQKASGNDVIYLDQVEANRKYIPSYGLEDVTDDPGHFINAGYSTYFDAPTVLVRQLIDEGV